MPTNYVGVPGSATAERTNPTIAQPADGDPGQASTFTPSLQTLANEVAALKQKVAYLDNAPFNPDPTWMARSPVTPGGGGSNPALGSGWGGTATAWKVWLTPAGEVRWQGTVLTTSGAPAATLTTLPAALRPAHTRIFRVGVIAASTSRYTSEVQVDVGGVVTQLRIDGPGVATGDIFIFDGVTYDINLS